MGNEIMLTESGNAGMGTATQVGVLTEGSVQFHIGAMSNQAVAFSMPNVYANRLGSGVVTGKTLQDIDVTTQSGAQDAIRIIDEAVTQLAQWRGDIGAFQANFLESTVRSLGTAKENIASSESQIRDADMAVEMTNYTRLQILQQSGMAMLSQANQSTQSILQLLQQ
jgi:flagellin